MPHATETDLDALCFDVFGTVVDWRNGVIRDAEALGDEHDLDADWAAFADAWREAYLPSLRRVRDGEIPWQNLDTLHRASLDDLLEAFGIDAFSESEVAHLNRTWHRLDPWPDAIPGLRQLKRRYLVATLSNGHVRLLANMAKRAGLPWDLILSAELAGHYKPDPVVYETAVDLLDVPPGRVMMVAAHTGDLEAASGVGMRTAFVHRPLEWGPDAEVDEPPAPTAYDVVADDLLDLADQLGA